MRFVDRYGLRFADGEDFESKHKRNENGQFAFIRGGETDRQLKRKHEKATLEEFYGEEIKGRNLRGRSAIFKLLEEKKGHIKNAFHRVDIGDIDLVWGDAKAGLAHVLLRRSEKKEDLKKVILNISNTIANGRLEQAKENERSFSIKHRGVRVLVSKSFKGKEGKRLVVSGYEILK